MSSIYDHPDVYEAVVQAPSDQVAIEPETLRILLGQRGVRSGRVLEIACGTCPHGYLLAEAGFSITGLDRSPAIVAEVRRRATGSGLPVSALEGDLVDFDVDKRDFVAAIFMSETFPLVTDYADLVSHFRSVRHHLVPGAIYVIDIDANVRGVGREPELWGRRIVKIDGGAVETWNESLPGDWVAGTSHLKLHCRIQRADEVTIIEDDWRIRRDSPWHLKRTVASLEGWKLAGFHSWRDPAEDIADEDHYFVVLERI